MSTPLSKYSSVFGEEHKPDWMRCGSKFCKKWRMLPRSATELEDKGFDFSFFLCLNLGLSCLTPQLLPDDAIDYLLDPKKGRPTTDWLQCSKPECRRWRCVSAEDFADAKKTYYWVCEHLPYLSCAVGQVLPTPYIVETFLS
jgi:hypothetical protein